MTGFPVHKPRGVEFIQQRGKSDCGVACAAMLVGCLYEIARMLFKESKKSIRGGLYPEDIFEVLEEIGFKNKELQELPQNTKALVAIQWMDEELSGHYVVWDHKRKQFLDPLHGVFIRRELNKYAYIERIWKIYRSKK